MMNVARKIADAWSLPPRKPAWGAVTIPLAYVIVSTAYIFFSGRIAKALARDTQQLAAIESVKGFGFVLVTGILLFVLCRLWMRRQEKQQALLVESEKKAVAGMASASVAHDLNNLLMALSGLVEELKDHEQGNDLLITTRTNLETSIEELSQLSKSLVRAARQLEPEGSEVVDVPSRLALVIRLLAKHPDFRRCTLQYAEGPRVSALLNGPLFEQAVLNLLINAAQAAGPGGTVELSVLRRDGTIEVRVDDSGSGITPREARNIFRPGYTTKKDGSGLGLLCVRAFADSCSGSVSVERSKLGGAAFLLRIPVTTPSHPQASE